MTRKIALAGLLAVSSAVAAWAGTGAMGGAASASASSQPGVVKLVGGGAFAPALSATSFAAIPAPSATASPDFSAVKAAIDAYSVKDVAIVIGNANGELYAYGKGNFTPDTQTDIASASKWLTGTLAYRLVEAGKVSLSDHPYRYLGYWTQNNGDTRSQMTLEQLLSLQSGFNAKPWAGGCVQVQYITLQNCTRTIYGGGIDTAPGTAFSYGPQHVQVAAGMVEAAGGASFDTLFAQYVTTPLGMTKTTFVQASTTNPWAAGGAQSSARDYAKLLRAMLAGGFIKDMNGFTQSRTTAIPTLYAPGTIAAAGDWKYSLGSWVECDGSDFVASHCADQQINSSPGAYGFTPWIDRKHGYYAVIAMNIPALQGDGVGIEQQVQPLIESALGN